MKRRTVDAKAKVAENQLDTNRTLFHFSMYLVDLRFYGLDQLTCFTFGPNVPLIAARCISPLYFLLELCYLYLLLVFFCI